MSSPRLSALPTRPGNITGWTERVPAFPLPDLPDRAGTKHTGPARLYGKLLADGGRHEPDRTAGLIRTTELQSKRWTLF